MIVADKLKIENEKKSFARPNRIFCNCQIGGGRPNEISANAETAVAVQMKFLQTPKRRWPSKQNFL